MKLIFLFEKQRLILDEINKNIGDRYESTLHHRRCFFFIFSFFILLDYA